MEHLLSALRVFVFAVFAVLALTSIADQCIWVPDPCGPEEQCGYHQECYPEYYVWQYVQPNWCLYGHFDDVTVQRNAQYQIVAWWVQPASNPGLSGEYAVVNNAGQCTLWEYPL